MTLINQLPQKVQKELTKKSLLKVISGLNNFDIQSVKLIANAALLGGADMIDLACKPELVEEVQKVSYLPICVSSVEPKLFTDSVKAGAVLLEIGNFDSFYEKGITFSAEKIISLTKETKDLLPDSPLSVTVPHTLTLDKQVELAIKLVQEGADFIQTEGGKSSSPLSSGVQGHLEKAVPTLSATFSISQEFAKNNINTPIMCASGLSEITCPLAIASGASAVGVGSVVNKLDNLIAMIAVVRALKESLDNSLIRQKIS